MFGVITCKNGLVDLNSHLWRFSRTPKIKAGGHMQAHHSLMVVSVVVSAYGQYTTVMLVIAKGVGPGFLSHDWRRKILLNWQKKEQQI